MYSETLPALRKPGQETFGGQVQWSGGAPAVGAPAEDGNVGGRPVEDRGISSRLCLPRERVNKELPPHEPRRAPPHSASSMLATCSHHWVIQATGIINPSHELTLPPTHLGG